jgi:hypothetical protein
VAIRGPDDMGDDMGRLVKSFVAAAGGLMLVPLMAAPTAASDFVTAQVEVDIGAVNCTVVGRSRVAFDPNNGPRGTSIIEFGTTVDDPDAQCHDWANRIGATASYRRKEDEDWLTATTESFGHDSASGSATVPGAIVDAEVFHGVEFFDTSCSLPPEPRCGPFGANFTTNPK